MSRVAPHIAVLMGGWSAEREVSLVSGAQCQAALERLGYRVSPLDVGRDIASVLSRLSPDLCFNALHGVGGEDGVIQGVLETLQIPYTHSGVLASALAMDKQRSKIMFAQANIPVAEDRVFLASAYREHPFDRPYVLKPVCEGSSVGIYMVSDPQGPLAPIDPTDIMMMAEVYVAGRELTCGVMGDTVFDVLEITTQRQFYDYAAKYEPQGSEHHVPAAISGSVKEQIQEYARAAHEVIGCRGVTRTDFRFDEAGVGLVALEINTQPGMTPVSLIPEMAAAQGIGFHEIVQWLVEDASCQK